jgi:hypothetical protein
VRFALLAVLGLCACPGGGPVDLDAGPYDAGLERPRYAHAHNDYEHPRPLFDALDAKFQSVEADVYLDQGELKVSHNGAPFKGTLRELYLEPLKARVAANDGGSVHGDGKPFFLWIDFKQNSGALQSATVQLLEQYPMLTRFADGGSTPGAVTVVLTGNATAKRALSNLPDPRAWIRDENDFSDADPPADDRWGYYAVSYAFRIGWDGNGTMPAQEKQRMRLLVEGAHKTGRKIRLYAAPNTRGYWQVARELGVDFINTDDLSGLSAFLSE